MGGNRGTEQDGKTTRSSKRQRHGQRQIKRQCDSGRGHLGGNRGTEQDGKTTRSSKRQRQRHGQRHKQRQIKRQCDSGRGPLGRH